MIGNENHATNAVETLPHGGRSPSEETILLQTHIPVPHRRPYDMREMGE